MLTVRALVRSPKYLENNSMKKALLLPIAVLSCALVRAQDPAPPAPIISIQLLGTGVPLLNPAAYVAFGQVTAGTLITAGTERMLFDCGQGIVTRLLQSGGPAASPNIAVDRVFISHLHNDHMADLPALYSYGWLFRQGDPMRIWGPGPGPNGPVGMSAIIPLLRSVFDADIYVRSVLFTLNAFDPGGEVPAATDLPVGTAVVYQNNGVKVTAFLVDHHPVTPSYGFRVDYMGHSVVYSGDTTYNPSTALIQMATGADVLLHEVYGWDPDPEIAAYHTTPEQAAIVFNAAKPKLAVYTHQVIPPGTSGADLVSRTRIAGYTGPLQLGSDLMTINVLPNFVSVANPLPHAVLPPEKAAVTPRPFDSVPSEILSLRPRVR
jgi:ribonuclease Z